MELECESCGKIDHVLVDGYPFGDRLLEGVMFMVKDQDGIPTALGVTAEAVEYFSDLNQSKWLRACEEFCERLDFAQCPKCGGDVDVWGVSIITPTPKVIPMMRGSDYLLSRLKHG